MNMHSLYALPTAWVGGALGRESEPEK